MSENVRSGWSADFIGEEVAHKTDKGNLLLRRWAGCWIDFVVLALLFFGSILVAGVFMAPKGLVPIVPESLTWLVVAIPFVAVLAYFPVTEGMWSRSLGKLVTGTIVVRRDGTPPGVLKAIIRTVTRLIEVNPFLFGGLPAGICVLGTKGSQRLGDLAADTYVVPTKALKAALASTD